MRRAGTALEALIAGLRGRPAAGADWASVIALANHALLTPALYASLAQAGQLGRLPRDAGEYLRFIHGCNRERNLRLRGQLREAVGALNRHGIVPLLLKGVVPLFLAPGDRVPARMTSDLDMAVDEAELAAARACLADLGYVPLGGGRELARPCDAGVLELRPAGARGFAPPQPVRRDGLEARIPSVQARAFHWMVHDLLKEGDYWRGRIGLRHLHDLAQLARSEDLDWRALRRAMPDRTARNAFDTQLRALHEFFGVRVPGEFVGRPMIRLQHWRRVFTASHPVTGAPLRLAGNLAWGAWKLSRSGDRALRDPLDLARRAVRVVLDRDLRSKV